MQCLLFSEGGYQGVFFTRNVTRKIDLKDFSKYGLRFRIFLI